MASTDHGAERGGHVETDLVAYLVLEAPDRTALAAFAAPLRRLVDDAAIRILDVVVVAKDRDGVVDALELSEAGGLESLLEVCTPQGIQLNESDVRLASLPLLPGSVGLVVLAEDRWATELSTAVRVVGGRIVAGERIQGVRVDRARSPDRRDASATHDEGSAS